MKTIDKYLITSLIIWLVALIESIGGVFGVWSITGKARTAILFVEAATLFALLLNCYAMKHWVYRHSTEASHRFLAWLILLALVLCVCGDIVNFNLPLTYHRYGGVIKHDYLADSVFFFAPGYALFLIAACTIALVNGLKAQTLVIILIIATLLGSASFMSMWLPNTGLPVSMITGCYAVLITLVGASGLALLMALNKSSAKLAVWLVASGLVLAMVADAVIGQFWLYGNNGQGYFPMAKYVNWTVYIGSQCLLIHLARLAVCHKKGRYIAVNKAL